MISSNQEEVKKTENIDMSKAFAAQEKGAVGQGYFVNSFGGKEEVKTQQEVLDDIKKKTTDKTVKQNLEATEQDDSTKAKRREFLYKVQELYSKKAFQMQKDIMDASPSERERMLAEIKDIGRFCSALEGEIRWLRNK